jgi:hypothetical protein
MRFLIALFFLITSVWADGGRIVGEKTVPDIKVILFAHPSPLRAGPIDFSIFLVHVDTQKPVLDASVFLQGRKISAPTPEFAWKGPGCVSPGVDLQAKRGQSGNQLLYAATQVLPEPGLWEIGVRVDRCGKSIAIPFCLEIGRPAASWLVWWPLLSMIPGGILLYFWRSRLIRTRRGP